MPIYTYKVNFNFDNGFDSVPDTFTRDVEANIITVKSGSNGESKTFNMNNADERGDFFSRMAMIGTNTVYPAKFATCPHHGGEETKTLAFALPISEYTRLADQALLNKGDFNQDRIPDVAYVNPDNQSIGYVHIEPTPESLKFGQIRSN